MTVASKKLLHAAIAGAIIFFFGLIMAFFGFPLIVNDQIHKQVRLMNGSDAFERWKELPVAVDFKVYLFHIENWKEVTFEGALPKVVEMGPYAYKQFRKKKILDYNDKEDSLTYTQNTHFEFDPKASGGRSEDDEVVILNVALNALFQVTNRYLPGILMQPVLDKYWIHIFPTALEESMFIEAKVGDILFDGYSFCNPDDWYGTAGIICIVVALLDISFLELQDDLSLKFSFFTFKQDNHDGIFTIRAGIDDVTKLGHITQWNGNAYNTIWGDRISHCNKIQGTDGTIYPPNLNKDEDLLVFSTDICRAAKVEYSGKEVIEGIVTQRRVLSWNTLADPKKNPENECYCSKYERNLYGEKKCLPNGLFDLSPCYNLPLIASFPHLLNADKTYAKTVEGLTPNEAKHRTFLNLEPRSGIPVSAYTRLQFNMILRPIDGITVTKNITPNVCPIAWIEIGFTLPENLIREFKNLLNLIIVGVEAVKWFIVAIGGFIFLICGGLYIYKIKGK